MKYDINDILMFISDTELINHNDELSELIRNEADNELLEFELDFVSAAVMPDYNKFQLYLENNM